MSDTNVHDFNLAILQALNSLRNESDVLVLYWENRLGVPHDTVASDGLPIKQSENNHKTLEEILDDVYSLSRGYDF